MHIHAPFYTIEEILSPFLYQGHHFLRWAPFYAMADKCYIGGGSFGPVLRNALLLQWGGQIYDFWRYVIYVRRLIVTAGLTSNTIDGAREVTE